MGHLDRIKAEAEQDRARAVAVAGLPKWDYEVIHLGERKQRGRSLFTGSSAACYGASLFSSAVSLR